MIKKYFNKINNGFTLIELLGVIILITIIALITTPIITNIIEDSKKAAFNRSIEGILEGTKLDVSFKLDDSGYIYTIDNGVIDNLESNISITNISKYNGTISYDSKANVDYAIYNDKYCIIEINGKKVIKNYMNNNCTLYYKNGDIIYYDVLNGTTCTNYHVDNSKLGYNGTNSTKTTNNQNSCLKFYAFNDNLQTDKVNLLLDHNIDKSKWSDTSDGPITILKQLKKVVADWVGTITPENYLLSQEGYVNYEIKYKNENYKARLITASEVAKITGHLTFDESVSNQSSWFYFDTNKNVKKDTCKNGDTSGCNFGWLYDRTSKSCIENGCLNSSDNETFGYWTATFSNNSSNKAWYIFCGGYLSSDNITRVIGIRPVIEVNKINL